MSTTKKNEFTELFENIENYFEVKIKETPKQRRKRKGNNQYAYQVMVIDGVSYLV